jgi:hypothetical protein
MATITWHDERELVFASLPDVSQQKIVELGVKALYQGAHIRAMSEVKKHIAGDDGNASDVTQKDATAWVNASDENHTRFDHWLATENAKVVSASVSGELETLVRTRGTVDREAEIRFDAAARILGALFAKNGMTFSLQGKAAADGKAKVEFFLSNGVTKNVPEGLMTKYAHQFEKMVEKIRAERAAPKAKADLDLL